MKNIILDSYGKINLALDVINRREDGYHNISTIMQEISLKDEVELIYKEDKNISIKTNSKDIPTDKNNLVFKAWELIKEKSGIDLGIEIRIRKEIPVSAGLAGGSSNAAATLKGLNELWKLNYTLEELEKIAIKIGADVPFCLRGGTVLARGVGNIFTDLKSFKGVNILLVNPKVPMDTKMVYEKINLANNIGFSMDNIVDEIQDRNIRGVSNNLYNKLEEVVIKEEDIVGQIKRELLKNRALGSLMSGSGTTVFGIFKNEDSLDYGYRKMKEKYPNFFIEKTKTR